MESKLQDDDPLTWYRLIVDNHVYAEHLCGCLHFFVGSAGAFSILTTCYCPLRLGTSHGATSQWENAHTQMRFSQSDALGANQSEGRCWEFMLLREAVLTGIGYE